MGLSAFADLEYAPVVACPQIREPFTRSVDQRSPAHEHHESHNLLDLTARSACARSRSTPDESPVDDDLFARYEQVAHPPIGPEHEPVDRVWDVRDVSDRPHRQVRRSPHFEAPQIRATKAGRTPERRELERFGC